MDAVLRWPCLNLPVHFFHHSAEVVFAHVDDAHLPFRALHRIAGVRGIDHDVGTKLTPHGARRRLGRIGRPQYVANLAYRFYPLVDQRDAALGSWLFGLHRVAIRRRMASHEFDDVVELVVAEIRSQDLPKTLLLRPRNLEPKLLLQRRLGSRSHDIFELGAQNLAHWPIKLRGLGHAHAMDFDAADLEAGAGKKINNVAGPARGAA